MLKEYDVVKAKKELTKKVLKNCTGAIVLIYQEPTLGYEVDFVDNQGDTLEVLTVYPEDDIEPVKF
ncbi:DUF4926 domain-containing protein [Mixta theicola]|uniref:DUF4926 domain-containing protein n=1 Tax=Mixta theicola TaxID=1458355 RepID=A0A2K1Q977_9GAMM|nr:DUF4926 domain-containing protein [Mixta theicola]PNS11598.1 DUF4926 domain-containing protein [Mixta theicola]GLR08691.1 hypothetical protein GCM10007905_14100 [Mixta theicola]